MKRILILGLLVCFALVSCEKKITAYWETVEGVYIKDTTGTIIDSMGTPNVFTEDSMFALNVYPNPCKGQLKYNTIVKTSSDYSYTVRLYPAEFKSLPANMPSAVGEGSIPVENMHLNGAFSVLDFGQGGSGGANVTTTADIGHLPRGFYKLVLTFDNGKEYWDNVWIYWP